MYPVEGGLGKVRPIAGIRREMVWTPRPKLRRRMAIDTSVESRGVSMKTTQMPDSMSIIKLDSNMNSLRKPSSGEDGDYTCSLSLVLVSRVLVIPSFVS